MFHVKHFRIAVIGALALASIATVSCTKEQTDAFVDRVTNFNRGVAAVDDSIARVSSTLYKNCTSLQAIGQAAVDVTGQCNKASPVVNAVNDVMVGYCTADPPSGIASAITTTAATVNATRAQLASAKKACAAGT